MIAPLAVFGSLGWTEILLILFIALLLFGGKRLPSLAKDLGDGIRQFRRSLTGESEDSSQQLGQNQSISKEEDSTAKVSKSKKSKSA
ncbi:twin-arginine translocase TatA/TatE family subunit [Leptospira ellisii]|uniref:Sec-independent protein translocase protein TatA n=2 Tax=Leptospira ellisii TaxID=2023197 RepID=A0A2N0B708_9LEPT|nr:twin-arginine translocase TatA/TatE family subunit [Leptospira ellisii]MDV6234861.1 twin-arginine translocase TatA/TatE family subunit [Leptospira ellisii]PJZ92303.1 twin-arginine translocase TatA/TatE family subunit [Leptospira ellisii]